MAARGLAQAVPVKIDVGIGCEDLGPLRESSGPGPGLGGALRASRAGRRPSGDKMRTSQCHDGTGEVRTWVLDASDCPSFKGGDLRGGIVEDLTDALCLPPVGCRLAGRRWPAWQGSRRRRGPRPRSGGGRAPTPTVHRPTPRRAAALSDARARRDAASAASRIAPTIVAAPHALVAASPAHRLASTRRSRAPRPGRDCLDRRRLRGAARLRRGGHPPRAPLRRGPSQSRGRAAAPRSPGRRARWRWHWRPIIRRRWRRRPIRHQPAGAVGRIARRWVSYARAGSRRVSRHDSERPRASRCSKARRWSTSAGRSRGLRSTPRSPS